MRNTTPAQALASMAPLDAMCEAYVAAYKVYVRKLPG